MRKMRRALVVLGSRTAAIGLCLVGVLGCSRPVEPVKQGDGNGRGVPLATVLLTRQHVRRVMEQPGYNVGAYQHTPVYAKVPGYVAAVRVDIGDRVAKGQVLAELSVPELAAEARQKEAAVTQAEAEIELARAAVERAVAEERRARSQYGRMSKLGGQAGVMDRENIDEARFGLDASTAAVRKAQADVGVASAKLQAAREDLGHVRALLGYTQLTAPFAGVVTRRNLDVGHFVQPAEGTRGEPLFVIDDLDRVRVSVDMPAADAVWVQSGAAASVRVLGLAGASYSGRVTRDAHALQPTNRTLRTEVDLANADHRLLPGMFAYVTITAERTGVWALPAGAVVLSDEGALAYRVDGERAIKTRVRTGLPGNEFVEILAWESADQAGGAWRTPTGVERFLAAIPAGEPTEVSIRRQ